MARYYHGLIVWAVIDDGNGNTETRPSVILDFDGNDVPSPRIFVIPITRSEENPIPYYHVKVHDTHDQDPYTGLYYPSFAKCNWARWIPQSLIRGRCGDMPDNLFEKIADAYDKIYEDQNFNDWQ